MLGLRCSSLAQLERAGVTAEIQDLDYEHRYVPYILIAVSFWESDFEKPAYPAETRRISEFRTYKRPGEHCIPTFARALLGLQLPKGVAQYVFHRSMLTHLTQQSQ